MNFSTRSKITILVFCSLGLLAVGTGVFTSWRVREAISEKLRENSANAVALSAAGAADQWKSLFQRKVDQAMRLQDVNRLQEETIRSFAEADGDLFASLRRMALSTGFSILAADGGRDVIFRHGDFPEDFNPYSSRDIKGRDVGETMLRLARNGLPAAALVRREAHEHGAKRLFGHHFYLPDRDLLIGLWTDIAPQLASEERDRDKAVATLAATFGAVRLGPSGFLMAVDNRGTVVIQPETMPHVPDVSADNSISGRPFLDDVRRAAADPEHAFMASLPWLGDGRRAIVFVQEVRSLGWYVIGMGFVDEIEDTGRRVSLVLSLAILALSAGLTLLAAVMVGKLTAPLAQLAAFAREVPGTDFLRDTAGNEVLHRLTRRLGRDEIGELARALAFMDGALRERVRELVATTGKRERMEGELHAATRIQMGFLPAPMTEAETGGRFQLAATLVPAREVGGDLYDFFMLDENRLFVAIGDVSDKGVPAALFMSMTMILLRASAEHDPRPAVMLERINSGLARDNANEMFVTLFLAVLDVESGELCYANGGHNPPHIVSTSGVRRLEGASGPLVGVFTQAVFSEGKTVLRPGETLFLHTDGVNEAMNENCDEFGEDMLRQVLSDCRDAEPEEVLARMREALSRHVAGAPASDDITMLCLRRGNGN